MYTLYARTHAYTIINISNIHIGISIIIIIVIITIIIIITISISIIMIGLSYLLILSAAAHPGESTVIRSAFKSSGFRLSPRPREI